MSNIGSIRFKQAHGRWQEGDEEYVVRFGYDREGEQYTLATGEIVRAGAHVAYEGYCETCSRWTERVFFTGCPRQPCPHGYEPCP